MGILRAVCVCLFLWCLGTEPRACSMPGKHSTREPCPSSMHVPYIWGLIWIMMYLHNGSCSGNQEAFLVILATSSLGDLWQQMQEEIKLRVQKNDHDYGESGQASLRRWLRFRLSHREGYMQRR